MSAPDIAQAQANPTHCTMIDANGTEEQVFQSLITELQRVSDEPDQCFLKVIMLFASGSVCTRSPSMLTIV